MPLLSDPPGIAPFLIIAFVLLLWKGGSRGCLCAALFLLSLTLGDWVICSMIKNGIARPRPFLVLSGAVVRVGRGGSFSMPSSHASNWFAAATVLYVYYRRTIWI